MSANTDCPLLATIPRRDGEWNGDYFARVERLVLSGTPAVAALAAASPLEIVRRFAARSTGATAEILTVLADDADRTVRALVAGREDTPLDVRAVLRADPVRRVRVRALTAPMWRIGIDAVIAAVAEHEPITA